MIGLNFKGNKFFESTNNNNKIIYCNKILNVRHTFTTCENMREKKKLIKFGILCVIVFLRLIFYLNVKRKKKAYYCFIV